MSLVTVLIVTHGRAEMLEKSFLSIRDQNVNLDPQDIVVLDDGDDTGAVRDVCAEWHVDHVYREKQPGHDGYISPAAAFNLGLGQIDTPLVVMQGPEILYTRPTDLANLIAPHVLTDEPNLITLASCVKLNQDGGTMFPKPKTELRAPFTDEEGEHYPVHAVSNKNIYFVFGCCFRPSLIKKIGGFEEGYKGWGFEDEDLQIRLKMAGVKPVWFPPEKVLTQHQWHPDVPPERINRQEDQEYFNSRIKAGILRRQ